MTKAIPYILTREGCDTFLKECLPLLCTYRGYFGFEMGRHSNIPDCCILFWLGWFIEGNNWRTYWKIIPKSKRKGWEYIPCPSCVAVGNKRKLHLCTLDCERWFLQNGFEDSWKRLSPAYKRIKR